MTSPIRLTKREAREFLLRAHFLLGPKLPRGQKSILKVLDRLKAIQVDSINVAGTNQEIILNSRIKGFAPTDLDRVLYEDRLAFEYWFKCLCILPIESRPCHIHRMKRRRSQAKVFLDQHKRTVRSVISQIRKEGPLSPSDFDDDRRCRGGWNGSERLVKRILEVLWNAGELMIHHRKGRMRHYDLSERCSPKRNSRISKTESRRQIALDVCRAQRLFLPKGGTGMIWHALGRMDRNAVRQRLIDEGVMLEVDVKGSDRRYAMLAEDLPLLEKAKPGKRIVRLLAPLDSLLWDRALIQDLFDFYCIFEVYKKKELRQFGYYCLPILYGTELVGRCDLAKDNANERLQVHSVHWEPGFKPSAAFIKEFAKALNDHARFTGMKEVSLPRKAFKGKPELGGFL